MHKKTITYLLLILVAAIWGFIGYKIYKTLNQSNDDVQEHNISFERGYVIEDTFSLFLNYDDPFTKKRFVKENFNPTQTNNHISFNINKPKVENNSTSIDVQYIGLIQNENRKTGLISINGKSVFVKEGQLIDSIRVVRFDKTQLVFKDNKGITIKLSTKKQ